MTTSAQLTVSAVAILLANPLADVYPSSVVHEVEHSLKSRITHSFFRGRELSPFTLSIGSSLASPLILAVSAEIGVERNVWWNALRSALCKDYSASPGIYVFVREGMIALRNKTGGDVCQSFSFTSNSGSRVSNQNDIDCNLSVAKNNYSLQPTSDQKTKVSERNSTRSSKKSLDSVFERTLERSTFVSERRQSVNRFDLSGGRIVYMPSKSSPTAAVVASPPNDCRSEPVVMDIESDLESSLLLLTHRSSIVSTGSVPPPMPSVPSSSSSSSSAQSSPVCCAPSISEPLADSIPVLSRSLPASLHGSIREAAIHDITLEKLRAHSRSQSVESVIARMTLDRNTPPINTNVTRSIGTGSERDSVPTFPSRSSHTPAFPPKSNTASGRGRPSYLSRSQRRLASMHINPSTHDVQHYLYQGGQTGVVSGGVMLGPAKPRDKPETRTESASFSEEQKQKRQSKTKKAQGSRGSKASKSKEGTSA